MGLMINKEQIRNKLYYEFIQPTNQKKDFIGVEIEIPIINLDKKAVDFDLVHEITHKFQNQYSDVKTEFENNKALIGSILEKTFIVFTRSSL